MGLDQLLLLLVDARKVGERHPAGASVGAGDLGGVAVRIRDDAAGEGGEEGEACCLHCRRLAARLLLLLTSRSRAAASLGWGAVAWG